MASEIRSESSVTQEKRTRRTTRAEICFNKILSAHFPLNSIYVYKRRIQESKQAILPCKTTIFTHAYLSI